MKGLTIGSRIADLYQIGVDIDEAPGGFARAFLATDAKGHERAFKVFRSEHFELPEERALSYYRTLGNEADLLAELKGHPSVVALFDVGYIWPKQGEEQVFQAHSFGMNVRDFAEAADEAFAWRFLPYLALQRMPSKHSLFRLVRRNSHGARLPSDEVIAVALQLGRLLVDIHARGILYWDPKPEHVYWDRDKVVLIDWNVSRRIGAGGPRDYAQDIQLVAQRVLYPMLVGGTSFATGAVIEATPGSSADPVVQEKVDYRWQEKWIDDGLRTWLDAALLGRYDSAQAFLSDIEHCAVRYGWPIPGRPAPAPEALRARECLARGLDKVREAHQLLEQATGDFAKASLDLMPEEYREAKRLSRLVRDLLENGWALP
jgi:serine/threonine protein kinase